MNSNKINDVMPDHYSAECSVCQGVLLPEVVGELKEKLRRYHEEKHKLQTEAIGYRLKAFNLEKEVERLRSASYQWRDLYQAASKRFYNN